MAGRGGGESEQAAEQVGTTFVPGVQALVAEQLGEQGLDPPAVARPNRVESSTPWRAMRGVMPRWRNQVCA